MKEFIQLEVMEDAFPESPTPNIKENQVMYHIYEPQLKGTAYIDLTGRIDPEGYMHIFR